MANLTNRDRRLVNAINNVWNMRPGDRYQNVESLSNAARSYVSDTKAEASTSVDVKDLPKAYVFIADMPGLKSADMKVQVIVQAEKDFILSLSGERERDEPVDGPVEETKYIQLERNEGKFLRKFTLPADSDLDNITAASSDGILTVTVSKLPPPEPHRPRTIDIKVT